MTRWTMADVQRLLPEGWRAEPYWPHPARDEIVLIRAPHATAAVDLARRTWALGEDLPPSKVPGRNWRLGLGRKRLVIEAVAGLRAAPAVGAPTPRAAKYKRLPEGGWAISVEVGPYRPCPEVGDVVMVRRASDHGEDPQTVLAVIRRTGTRALLAFRPEEAELAKREATKGRLAAQRKRAAVDERADWIAAKADRPEPQRIRLGPEIRHVNRPYRQGQVLTYAMSAEDVSDMERRQGIAATELPGGTTTRRRVVVVVEHADRDDDGYTASVRLATPEEAA